MSVSLNLENWGFLMSRKYLLLDDRASDVTGTDGANILVTCESNEEAKGYKGDFGAMSCYSYAVKNGELVDERFEWNWFPD